MSHDFEDIKPDREEKDFFRQLGIDCLRRYLAPDDVSVPARRKELVLLCYRSRVEVDFAFLSMPENKDTEAAHRDSAIKGMQLLAKREDCYFEQVAERLRTSRSAYRSISFDPSLLKGSPVSVDEFLGAGYDLSDRRFTVKSWIDLMNVAEERAGFAYAFCGPPYGPVREYQELFSATLADIFEWFSGKATIYRWNDAWSNYFDYGKEWWGTFFWTVHLDGSPIAIALGASTTD